MENNSISAEDIKALFGERITQLMLDNFVLTKQIESLMQDKVNLLEHIQIIEEKLQEQGIVMDKENTPGSPA